MAVQPEGSTEEPVPRTEAELAQDQLDLEAGFNTVVAEESPRKPAARAKVEDPAQGEQKPAVAASDAAAGTQQAAATDKTEKGQPATGPLIAGMTDDELKTTLAKVSGFDAALGKEVQRVFGKIGEVERVLTELKAQVAKGGGGRTVLKLTPAMLKRVNEELPGFGDALAQDLNEAFNNPDAAQELKDAKADAVAKGEEFDHEKYYAEKLGPALSAFEKKLLQRQDEAFSYAAITQKHEKWQETINSPEFIAYAYIDGPTEEERVQHARLANTDPAGEKAMTATIAQKYPQWWGKFGHLINSDKPADAIKMLDQYVEHTKKPPPQATRSKSRLEAAIPVKGAPNTDTRQTMSDEEAAQAGFDSVADSP